MTGGEIFLVDSNILIYNFDASDIIKHKVAKQIIDRCLKGENKLAVSSQNLSEFFSVATSKKLLTKREAVEIISNLIELSNWIKIDFNHKTVLDAAFISEEHGMSYWDSLLAATMRQSGIFNLYTENAKDFKMKWMNVVNPFGKKNS